MGTGSSTTYGIRIDTHAHEHQFSLRTDEIHKNTLCKICDRLISSPPYYVCDICKYYIHKSCYALPYQINHSFHPSHALTLSLERGYWCGSCHQYFSQALSYRCKEDKFDMDIKCALMPPITCEGQMHIQHFSHQHPMPLLEFGGKDEIQCFACQSKGFEAFYGCTKCKYFLHKSCAELPNEFQHPFHSAHSLYLRLEHGSFSCKSCYKRAERAFIFTCNLCEFIMCVNCHKKTPTIEYKYHEHLLCFMENYYKNLRRCDALGGYCRTLVVSNEQNPTKQSVFRCMDCSFVIHMLCGPLPSTIKHECHLHSLSLVDSIVEDNFGEYYCDVCEAERDPRIRVYYCEECRYIIHIHCVISEVLNILNGDLKDVELRAVGEDQWGSVGTGVAPTALTMTDIIQNLDTKRRKSFESYYYTNYVSSDLNTRQQKPNLKTVDNKEIDEVIKFSSFSDKDFESFAEELFPMNSERIQIELPSEFKSKTVDIEGYMIPVTLAPVTKTLLHKYGDVSVGSDADTKEMKSLTYGILCHVLNEMSTVTTIDVTKNLLRYWCCHLRFVIDMGFECDFVFEHLKRLIRAFVGLQAKRLQEDIPKILDGWITKKQEEIRKLKQEIAMEKRKLKICRQFGTSSKSRLMEECLKEAVELKWKRAYEGFLL